jgi:RNA recognition motif-containing protein
VIFEEVSAATAAVYAEDGFVFFGRPLKVAYAWEKSDRVAKQDGSFSKEVKEKRGRKRAAAEAAAGGGESLAGVAQKHVKIEGGGGIIGAGGAVAVEGQQTVPDGPPSGGGAIPPPPPPPPPPAAAAVAEALAPPSKFLFAQDVPAECNEMMLAMLFRQHVGYKEVRIPRPGLAFIEFEDEPHATLALKALNGFKLTSTEALKLTYGKN